MALGLGCPAAFALPLPCFELSAAAPFARASAVEAVPSRAGGYMVLVEGGLTGAPRGRFGDRARVDCPMMPLLCPIHRSGRG